MHESSIAGSILKIAEREAREHGASRVVGIRVRLGELSGVVRESLEFAFAVMREGTMAEGAELVVGLAPLRVECESCVDGGGEGMAAGDLDLICRGCGGVMRITGGREMLIESLDLDFENE